MTAVYDWIGLGYADVRRPDPRLAALITTALADARSILNVGAGAGSYEPPDREVVAVEPSQVMLNQHPGIRRVRGSAEALPFRSGSFDVAMAVMTVHHWPDLLAGLREMTRVARRQVVFTWDPDFERELWVVTEYLPEIRQIEHARFTPLQDVVDALGAHTVLRFGHPVGFHRWLPARVLAAPQGLPGAVDQSSELDLRTAPKLCRRPRDGPAPRRSALRCLAETTPRPTHRRPHRLRLPIGRRRRVAASPHRADQRERSCRSNGKPSAQNSYGRWSSGSRLLR